MWAFIGNLDFDAIVRVLIMVSIMVCCGMMLATISLHQSMRDMLVEMKSLYAGRKESVTE